MKKYLRILALVLCFVLTLTTLCACGATSGNTDDTSSDDDSSSENNDDTSVPSDTTTAGGADETTVPVDPADTSPNNSRAIRVLFIGNSLTFYNDMPEIVERLGKAAGKDITVESATQGSSTFCQQTSNTHPLGQKVINAMKQKWDYVVIQPSRRITPKENTVKTAEHAAGKVLDSWIKNAGAETIIYGTWGNNTGNSGIYTMTADGVNAAMGESYLVSREEHNKYMQTVAREFADELEADMVDCAELYEYMVQNQPNVNMYYTDERHPSLYGSFSIACAFYAYLYGESSVNAAKGFHSGIEEDVAVMLAKSADHIVLGTAAPEKYNIPVKPVVITEDMKEWKGTGTAADPFIVSCAEEFRYFIALSNAGETFTDKFIKQTADIDLGGKEIGCISANETLAFAGTYDGDGHTIGKFSISTDVDSGIFAYTNKATIKNVKVASGTTKGNNAGVLAGSAKATTFENIMIDGSSSAEGSRFAGGIVACCDDNTVIKNCVNAAPIIGYADTENIYLGGICGIAGNAVISYCYNKGSVTVYCALDSKTGVAGGIIGANGYNKGGACNIDHCANEGSVIFSYDGPIASRGYTGGIVGRAGHSKLMPSTVSDCYNIGKIVNMSTNTKHYGYYGQILGCVPNPTLTIGTLYGLDTVTADLVKEHGADPYGMNYISGKPGSGVSSFKLSTTFNTKTAAELEPLIKAITDKIEIYK